MVQEESDKTEVKPKISDPEWSDYVLSLFTEDELFEGLPKVDGLRRVAQLVLGEIVYSCPDQIFPVLSDGPGRATVSYKIKILCSNGIVKEFGEVSDVWIGNTDSTYMAFAVATASTRSEGRALRKALGLKTVCFEEMATSINPAKEVAERSEILIQSEQVDFVDMKCKKKNINVMSFINSGEKQYATIYDVTKDTAGKMIKALRDMLDGKDPIPDNIIGYDSSWRNK